jgi:hypothetical protein
MELPGKDGDMSEHNTAPHTTDKNKEHLNTGAYINQQLNIAGEKIMGVINLVVPTYESANDVAYALARFTPRTVIICFVVLFAAILGSRLNIWAENFLWGIPALGAIFFGFGFWVWSSNLMLRPDLSDEARETLRRAIKLQWSIVAGGVLAIIYFAGMAAGYW